MKTGLKCLVIMSILLAFLALFSSCKPVEQDNESAARETPGETAVPLPQVKILAGETMNPTVSPTSSVPSLETAYPLDDEVMIKSQETETPAETVQSKSSFDYPSSHYIRNIAGHSQHYYLSCESSAAIDWAWFFGVNIYESTFQADMPRSDNPDYGYVGDYTTRVWGQIPPYSYGVHAGPIAEGLRAYDLPALAVKGFTLDEVKQKLSEDKPIIVWIIGNLEYSEPVEYVDKEGRVAIVAPFEHVVILTGYDTESVRYMNNGKFYDAPTEVFLTSWGVLGNMAVVYDDTGMPKDDFTP